MSTIAVTLDNFRMPIGLSPTLQRPKLVLNRNWQPINMATFARVLIVTLTTLFRVLKVDSHTGMFAWEWTRSPKPKDSVRITAFLLVFSYTFG